MEIKILEERTNPLLKRHELRFEVAHATAATPTRDLVRTELAKAVHAHKDRVVIERMHPRFGTAVTRGEANVYETADAAKSITREHILVRNGLKEKPAKGPAAPPAEAPKAESAGAAAPPAPAVPAPTESAAPPTKEPPSDAAAPSDASKRPKTHAKKE
jgi:small subunit ribosomal protein S24e